MIFFWADDVAGVSIRWRPGCLDLFGGRQSARTIHFITATFIVLFILVHLVEVLLSGVFNEMRSILTGWFAVKAREDRCALGASP